MSDDAAFIATIQSTPFDDTPRLVYADWLEERGEAEKAEYLRIVYSLTATEGHEAVRENSERLIILAASLDEKWRDAVARRFDVVLEGWLGGAMFLFVKAVRWLVGQRPIGSLEPDESTRTIKLRSAIRREEAESYLNEADGNRFERPTSEKTAYRIVPTRVMPGVLHDTHTES